MRNQDQRESPGGTRESGGMAQRTSKTANEAYSTASAMAGEVAGKAKQVAADTAASVTGQVTQLLDRQVDTGADMIGNVARSAKRAAEELERESPQLAGFVHTFADRIDGYAGDLRGQSAEQLLRTASDFTRRQPGLVFGLAALAGFLAWRTLKSGSLSSPPIQPTHDVNRRGASDFHGT